MKNETVKKVLLGMAMASPLALINSGNVHASSVSTNIETKWHANSLAIVQQELRNQNINPDYKITNAKYVVQAGDTLSQIAAATHINMYHIAAVNHIQNLNLIYVGQVLILNQGNEVAHNVAGNGSTTAASIGNTYTLRSASQQPVLNYYGHTQSQGTTGTPNVQKTANVNSQGAPAAKQPAKTIISSVPSANNNNQNVKPATPTGNSGANAGSNVSENTGSTANNSSSANTSVSGSVNTGSTQTPSASSQQPASSVSSSEQPVASSSATQGSESSTNQATGSNASSATQQTPSVSSNSQQTGVSSSSQQKQPVISSSASSDSQQTPSVSSSSQQTGVSSSTAQGSVSSSSQQSTTSSTSSVSQATSSSQTQGSVSSSQTTTSSSTQQSASSSQSSVSSSSHSTTSSSNSKQPTSSASSASQSSATSSSQSSASSSSQSSASSSSQQKTVDGYTLDNMPLSVFNDKKNLDAINNTFSGDEIENYFNNHIGKGNMTWDEAQQAQQNGQVTSAILAWNGQMLPTSFNNVPTSVNISQDITTPQPLLARAQQDDWNQYLPSNYLNNDSQKAQINKKYGNTGANDELNASQSEEFNNYMLNLVNNYRKACGLAPATTNQKLQEEALNRAQDITEFSHSGYEKYGYNSENLSEPSIKFSDPQNMSMFDIMGNGALSVYGWLFQDSSENWGHRQALLNCSQMAFATKRLPDGKLIVIMAGNENW